MNGLELAEIEEKIEEKVGELRRAALTQAAATIFAARLAVALNPTDEGVITEIKELAARDAVQLFFKV